MIKNNSHLIIWDCPEKEPIKIPFLQLFYGEVSLVNPIYYPFQNLQKNGQIYKKRISD